MKQRLQRHPYLFALSLVLLGFLTLCLAVTWRLFGDPLLLVLSAASVAPAFWLFYIREKAALEAKRERQRRG